MRLIVIGCEYTGKTTLIDGLYAWGEERGFIFHLDDHFSIPDQFFLSPEDQAAMIAMPPTIKERFQRFQIYYHVYNVMLHHDDCLLGGYHIEEAIYGPRYYYPKNAFPSYHRRVEVDMPEDTILLLLTASLSVIRQRMEQAPHLHPLVKPEEVEEISAAFKAEYNASWIGRKFTLDTSDLAPEQLVRTFLTRGRTYFSTRDLLRFEA